MDEPDLPAFVDLEIVVPLVCAGWTRRRTLANLRRLGVIVTLGDSRPVVGMDRLHSEAPAIWLRVFEHLTRR